MFLVATFNASRILVPGWFLVIDERFSSSSLYLSLSLESCIRIYPATLSSHPKKFSLREQNIQITFGCAKFVGSWSLKLRRRDEYRILVRIRTTYGVVRLSSSSDRHLPHLVAYLTSKSECRAIRSHLICRLAQVLRHNCARKVSL